MNHLVTAALIGLIVLSCRLPDEVALNVTHHQLNSSYFAESSSGLPSIEDTSYWGKSPPYQSYGVTATWELGDDLLRTVGSIRSIREDFGPMPPFEIDERGLPEEAWWKVLLLQNVETKLIIAALACWLAYLYRDTIRRKLRKA